MRIILLLFGLCYFTNIHGQRPQWELSTDSINIEGVYRSFEYYVPDNLKNTPSLMFFMHGSGGTIERIRSATNYEFEKIARERKNYIIVYPLGFNNYWNDCRASADYDANKEDINEIAFFNDMIDYFVGRFKVDPDSVFASGVSNGGHMCFKLAYEMPEKFKGIAPLLANLPDKSNNDCLPKEIPISIMIINGTDDPINPYEGGWVVVRKDSTRGKVVSTKQTIKYWANLLTCNYGTQELNYPDITPEDNSTLQHFKFKCPDSQMSVEIVNIINGGHTIPLLETPALSEQLLKVLGRFNNDINSPMLVIDFFESLK